MEELWERLSREMSERIAKAGESIVAIDGRSGHTSSGIVWRPDYVLTASHTVRGAAAGVLRPSGKPLSARLAGRAHGADIALLKLDESVDQPTADFGNAAALAVGHLVAAIGRTRRGHIVASAGILSGLMGEWRSGQTRIDQFIRPDLTLYPGFSGGALIGSGGTILGMMTGGFLRRKPLAIPASTLTRVAEELVAKGHTTSPYVGVVMQAVGIGERVQKLSGLEMSTGLLVMHVEPSGPADKGGVLVGDILVSLDGQACEVLDDLHEVLLRRGVHQTVQVILIRGGQKIELPLTIGERPLR